MDGDNYWGTQEEWDQVERRKEGREGRKYHERRNGQSKQSIAESVLNDTDVTVDELKASTQTQMIVEFRREAMARMYMEGYGPTEIGTFFNQTPGSVNNAWIRWNEEQNQ